MHRKTSKLAATTLLMLLYAQGLLGFAGVMLVVVKDRGQPEPMLIAAASNPLLR